MKEKNIQTEVMLACSERGDIIWRNNTGMAYQGTEACWNGRNLMLSNAHIVRFGLTPGSSDLIGIRHMVVTPEMVGTTIGVFMALEVKTLRGRASEEQVTFINNVNDAGGIAQVVRGVGDIP